LGIGSLAGFLYSDKIQNLFEYPAERDRDMRLELAKSGVIGKILMSRAHGRPLQIFLVFLYIFYYYFKKFSGTDKIYAYCKCE